MEHWSMQMLFDWRSNLFREGVCVRASNTHNGRLELEKIMTFNNHKEQNNI